MSLIHEALKRASSLKNHSSPIPPSHSTSQSPPPSPSLPKFALSIFLASLIISSLLYFILNPSSPKTQTPSTSKPTALIASSLPSPTPPPLLHPTTKLPSTETTNPSTPQSPPSPQLPTLPLPTPPHTHSNDSIDSLLASLNVIGVMITESDSKVLINNSVLSSGTPLPEDPSLTLIQINPNHLTFIDSTGKTYSKQF